MSNIVYEIQENIALITFNRVDKHNAFDDALLVQLQQILDEILANKATRILILKANGVHFCAGADLSWMKRMASFSEQENQQDAMVLAKVMHTLYTAHIPTLAMVQGCAFGGGAGLVAACDIAIAADNARFCFSEVKLGLIPSVISPYVIKAIGPRIATTLFMSAETFDAAQALSYGLVHRYVPLDELEQFTIEYARHICHNAPNAVKKAKALVRSVASRPIDDTLLIETADKIAKQRVSAEGQKGLTAFLNKEKPNWS